MIIWIVDDDVGFAYRFKNRLKAPNRRLEVFTDADSFLKKTEKLKKEKLPPPDIVFMDVEMPGRGGIDLYLEFLNRNDPLTAKFYFCSAMSYGRFSSFFESQNLKPPPFVQKSRLEDEWEAIIGLYRPEDQKTETAAPAHPLVRRSLKEYDGLKKELGDLYYQGAFGSAEIPVFVSLVEKIGAVSRSLNRGPVVEAAGSIVEILKKSGLGSMRVKKEIRDFMAMLEKWKG